MEVKPINFVGQLYDVRTKKDGGGRIQIDFGADALSEITRLIKLNGTGEINLGVAIVPFRGTGEVDFMPDENGEIQL